jgi:mono/diheme cytochrome c family protein
MPRFPLNAWFFFACAFVVLAGGIVAIRRLPGIEPFAVAIMLTMIALITLGFAVQGYRQTIPVTAGTTLVNPTSADAGSIQRGADLYTMLCLQCHGPGGGGIDDNDPDHLHPGGTNLTDRQTTGQTDGDLFWSISAGVGGTDMPAFDTALTEEERWDLVNYLRTLRAADAERALDEQT